MSTCTFYVCKTTKSVSKILTGNRNPKKPTIREIKKCSHPESKNSLGTIGTDNVACEGNIEKCIIPEHLR